MAKFSEQTFEAPTLDSYVHHIVGMPSAPQSRIAPLRDMLNLQSSQVQTLVGKSIDADNNFLSNIGFAEIKSDLIIGAPAEGTANDGMNILVEDGGALKQVSRLNFLQNITGAGEINTASSVGGGESITLPKVVNDLPFKSFLGTSGEINITPGATDLTFSLGANAVKTGAANDFGQFEQKVHSGFFAVANPAGTFNYTIVGAAITDNRQIDIPLLGANDTFAFVDHAQVLTNKSINASNNTITNINDASITSHVSTKISVVNKAQLNPATLYNDVDNSLGAHYLDVVGISQPPAPGSGVVRLYRDSLTNELMVIDDSNLARSLEASSSSPVITRILAADVPFTDQTIFADVADLGVSLGSNSTYTMYAWLNILPAGNPIEYRFSAPTGATGIHSVNGGIVLFGIATSVAMSQASGTRTQLVTGSVKTGASPGVFTLRVRHSGTPSGDTVTVKAQSYIQMVKE